jgi:hypothetical protein
MKILEELEKKRQRSHEEEELLATLKSISRTTQSTAESIREVVKNS